MVLGEYQKALAKEQGALLQRTAPLEFLTDVRRSYDALTLKDQCWNYSLRADIADLEASGYLTLKKRYLNRSIGRSTNSTTSTDAHMTKNNNETAGACCISSAQAIISAMGMCKM